MITFEERPDKGENWKKTQNKREQLANRDLEKANKPDTVFDKSIDEDKKTKFTKHKKGVD